ncbi:DMT family transporter [Streptomyces sp. NBC_01260]|uniref:DMT family transporter n=1 Tax=unclassified Streptomyces TaxID=2593676 RepID=UPI000F4A5D64|nr:MULTISPECIES: DMT family transporter [unclassified Streptomyces]MCX4773572.1 DMT family transporter [Streptomyces sp. NBC_01285]ROQ73858.1 drug/metabolite transporter (DMT)-like permease [Streptomyces sp. CEV 2-1]RPK34189.1 putative amino-acid metabolite efflux pump [Streptomyces sp. ADI92-24]
MTTTPAPAPRSDWRAPAAACTTVVLWASAFVSIRSAGEAYSPGALALGRLLTGSLALGALLLIRREGLPSRAAWPGIIASGLLWFGLYMVVLNWGEQQVDAGTAAMVVNIGPLLIALLGARLLGEGLPRRLVLGMAVSFAGAVVVGLSMSGKGSSSVLGVLLCLLAAVAYAAGVVGQKPALGHGSALQITTFGCLVGTVACLPFSGALLSDAADAPLSATLNMVYLGLFPTALAFTTWAYALARTTAGRMGATTYAVPALVVLMAWLLLNEVPALLTIGGGLLCLAGVAVSRMRPQTGATRRNPARPMEGPRHDTERRAADRP